MSWVPKEFVNPGDIRAAVIDIIDHLTPELADYEPFTVASNLRGYSRDLTWVRVNLTGDIWRAPKIRRSRVDVDVRAVDETVAFDIAQISLASILRFQGGLYTGFGLKIVKVGLEQGVTQLPEKLQEVSRYLFSVRVTNVPYGSAPAPPC